LGGSGRDDEDEEVGTVVLGRLEGFMTAEGTGGLFGGRRDDETDEVEEDVWRLFVEGMSLLMDLEVVLLWSVHSSLSTALSSCFCFLDVTEPCSDSWAFMKIYSPINIKSKKEIFWFTSLLRLKSRVETWSSWKVTDLLFRAKGISVWSTSTGSREGLLLVSVNCDDEFEVEILVFEFEVKSFEVEASTLVLKTDSLRTVEEGRVPDIKGVSVEEDDEEETGIDELFWLFGFRDDGKNEKFGFEMVCFEPKTAEETSEKKHLV
jgi:hypothetical protein